MIKIENTAVYGWEAAIRGMRNPMNSWNKSDSGFFRGYYIIGPNDLALMRNLIEAGTDHSKFMRMINVSMDITAPLYWWKEYDTYKVGTVANSCSTMHKIAEKEFTIDDFSHEHLLGDALETLESIVEQLNFASLAYCETGNKDYWWQMIQLLPSSYNQKRTILTNYAVLRNQYFARRNHKLDEWRIFCKEIERLPYSSLITETKEEAERGHIG